MKTIALKEKTFALLDEKKHRLGLKSFDALLNMLFRKQDKIPDSMRGILKGKTTSFTIKERADIWGE